MDVAANHSKPSYRRTYRKHRKLLSLPMVLGVIVAGFFLFHTAHSYRSTASLWVDTTPPSPSSVGASNLVLSETPAQAEQSLLSELLSTRRFDAAVANDSLLGKALGSQANIALHAGGYLGPKLVTSLAPGPQVLQVAYTGSNAALVQSTLSAVLKELVKSTNGLGVQRNDATVQYDKAQVTADSKALAAARGQVDAYLTAHPHATSSSDPNLGALTAAVNSASTQLATANSNLSQASSSSTGTSGWLVHVVDPASQAISTSKGKKLIVEVLLAGLFGGGLISFLGAVALTPTRKPEPWEDELVDVRSFDPDDGRIPAGVASSYGAGLDDHFAVQREAGFRHQAADIDER